MQGKNKCKFNNSHYFSCFYPQGCALNHTVNTVSCLSAMQARFAKSDNVLECPQCNQLSYTIMPESVVEKKKASSRSTSSASDSREAKLNIVENKFITRPLQEGALDKCFTCYEPYPFATVKLNCSCVDVMCQVCVRTLIKHEADTYFGAVSCPTCKKDCSTAIHGVRETAIYENKLIMDALKHFG